MTAKADRAGQPPLVDTHCHLADPRLIRDLDGVLMRAREAGVSLFIAVGAIGSIESDRLTVEIAERNPDVYAAVGVHPHDARDLDAARLEALAVLCRSPRVVALGETGLDFHYMRSPKEAQEDALRRHLELAAELSLPVVIHCRSAEARLSEVIRETGLPAPGGVIHCFTGDERAVRDFVALGLHISFSGILTFKNAAPLRETARLVPDERLLVETDAPYLAPEPLRGRTNEPAYVGRTLKTLATLRETDPISLARTVVANARSLFRIRG